jgi:branched-chain amino acid transport system permease protein
MASSLAAEPAGAALGHRLRARWPWPAAALAVALVALPNVADPFVAYQVALFLIYGIATQGVALCWGRLGFLPLGHALFFGLGAYLAGGVAKAAGEQPAWWAAFPLALLLPAALAWGVARLIFARSVRSGPYFSLVTLAMTMLGFLAAQQWSAVTGGFNGLGRIPEPPGLDRFTTLYWPIAAAAVASTALLGALAVRPIGVVWRAIAQNEERMQLFGYATDRTKADAYALSALLAAGAGALFAFHQGIVTPQAMGFVLSTEFVIWAAVGGKASPLGALLGAVVVGHASAELRDHFLAWEVFVGLLFIAVVRFLPDGIAGLATSRAFGAFRAFAAFGAPRTPAVEPAPVPAPPTVAPKPVPALAFEAVHCAQGGVRILDGLDFRLEGPGLRALIGPNGAGKTSAFNALTGRLPVGAGRIRLGGHDVTGRAAWQVARLGVGRKLQVPSVFPDLSVRENLGIALWAGRLRGADTLREAPHRWRSALQDEMLEGFPELAASLDVPAGRLSQGHRQALEFTMTVLPEPHLLLLDEPCAGLSPAETRRMSTMIQRAVARLEAAALLIEHDLAAVAALQGEVWVLHQGRMLARGPLAAVQADPAVRAVYAGARK